MGEYKYQSDYERQETQKYEGAYTAEEIELNNRLFEECSKAEVDFEAVEELLKKGADPLGGTAVGGWGLLAHIYDDLISDSKENDSIYLPKLTELFLKYGMDVENPRVPYDDSNSLHPLWEYAFVTNENAIFALKMLLDHGLSADSFAEFWAQAMFDFINISCGDPQNDKFWNFNCTWTFKMLLLGASYVHILSEDEELRNFICCDYNSYDIHKFRDWNNFEYYFDTSHCDHHPELYKSIVHIYDKETHAEVWKIGVGMEGRQLLANMNL